MSNPDVSVIVPMRNAAQHVLEQVTALANQTAAGIDFEVIWVDNASDDGTPELVARAIRDDPRMRLVSAPEVHSSYFARNRGVAVARADLLLFCDADDVVDKNWVKSMSVALGDLDVVGGALRFSETEAAVVLADAVAGFLPAARTANLGIRRSAFAELDGFDGSIPSGEDWALCWRAQLRGCRFGFAPDAVVLYRRRPSEWATARQVWARGRWYRDWASAFVGLGADAPTVRAAIRRIVDSALASGGREQRRERVRVLVWNVAVISSCVWRPKRRSA